MHQYLYVTILVKYMFKDRKDAGIKLTDKLSSFRTEYCVVYGLPRGGVPVAYEIAMQLEKPLEALIVRKIGMPGQVEVALGAIAEGVPPVIHLNTSLMARFGLSDASVKQTIENREREISEMRHFYRESREFIQNRDAVAIVVDDGVATGATMKVALKKLREMDQRRIVVAVPVSQISVMGELEKLADEVVCLEPVLDLYAVGEFYTDFSQVSNDIVVQMLRNNEERLKNLPHRQAKNK